MYVIMCMYMCGKNQTGACISTAPLKYNVTYSFCYLEVSRLFFKNIIIDI